MVNSVEKDFENKKIVKTFKDEKIKNLNKKLKYVERGVEIVSRGITEKGVEIADCGVVEVPN